MAENSGVQQLSVWDRHKAYGKSTTDFEVMFAPLFASIHRICAEIGKQHGSQYRFKRYVCVATLWH